LIKSCEKPGSRFLIRLCSTRTVIESVDNQELYFGYTNDLKRRFKEHNQNRTYAIGVIPVKLVLAKAGNGNPGL